MSKRHRKPERFLKYRGVKVWHVYDDDGMVLQNWFTVNKYDHNGDWPLDGDDAGQFDVRDLPLGHTECQRIAESLPPGSTIDDYHRALIVAAIDKVFDEAIAEMVAASQ